MKFSAISRFAVIQHRKTWCDTSQRISRSSNPLLCIVVLTTASSIRRVVCCKVFVLLRPCLIHPRCFCFHSSDAVLSDLEKLQTINSGRSHFTFPCSIPEPRHCGIFHTVGAGLTTTCLSGTELGHTEFISWYLESMKNLSGTSKV
jgi:hypothetical protein